MKKGLFVWALVMPLMASGFSPLFADCGQCGEGDWIEKKLDRMEKKLDLSADQKVEIRAILEEKHEKKKEMKEQMKSLHDETHDKIKAVLDDKQARKFEKMNKSDKKKMKKHRHKKKDR